MTSDDILDLLGRASAHPTSVHFVTARGARETSFGEIWSMSTRAASAIARSGSGAPLAGVMTPSPGMVACFIGSLRAGSDFVSIPLPGRGQSAGAYAAQVRTILDLAGVERLVVEAAYAPILGAALPELGERLLVAEALIEAGDAALRPRDHEPGSLIQFSSGTTGAPKGVRLSTAAVGANVTASLEALEARPGEVFCFWVPLSHDMGLIGGLLTSWASCCATGTGAPPGKYVCISPELFLARPALWMEACATHRATITAAPTFAYQLLARHLPRSRPLDLSSLRACIVGAEPISAETLRQFEESARPHGFGELALCPAYGLAEATLAVSIVPPSQAWSTVHVDTDGRRIEHVSCGKTLRSIEVAAPELERGPGPILIRGASVCEGFVPPRGRRSDGWLDTGDLGAMTNGELLVTGRGDDLLCLAGRNLFAWELEREAAQCADVRSGNCVAVPDGRGRYVIFFEPVGSAEPGARQALIDVRRRLAGFAGVGPSGVGCLPRGRLPKTPSGKIRRNSITADLAAYTADCTTFQEF
jgi:acyl-CoA synthetase (AMP-forming)/AMP-acid ligase II